MDNQKRIIIAFISTLALVGLVTLWMLVLNKGTANVHLDPPFSIQVGKNYQQCSENPCKIKINAYKYFLKVEKAGYFSFNEEIQLKRRQTINIHPKLQFIPYLQEEQITYEKLPENIYTEQPILLSLNEEKESIINEFKNIEIR
ncbi:MAG: PEGA domain-containing protein, partial [Candidatus Heimdallarchaeota archaeon]|nr:PEGA domain-containing protein [Candidatus Heimdallarchaeota archaeon]